MSGEGWRLAPAYCRVWCLLTDGLLAVHRKAIPLHVPAGLDRAGSLTPAGSLRGVATLAEALEGLELEPGRHTRLLPPPQGPLCVCWRSKGSIKSSWAAAGRAAGRAGRAGRAAGCAGCAGRAAGCAGRAGVSAVVGIEEPSVTVPVIAVAAVERHSCQVTPTRARFPFPRCRHPHRGGRRRRRGAHPWPGGRRGAARRGPCLCRRQPRPVSCAACPGGGSKQPIGAEQQRSLLRLAAGKSVHGPARHGSSPTSPAVQPKMQLQQMHRQQQNSLAVPSSSYRSAAQQVQELRPGQASTQNHSLEYRQAPRPWEGRASSCHPLRLHTPVYVQPYPCVCTAIPLCMYSHTPVYVQPYPCDPSTAALPFHTRPVLLALCRFDAYALVYPHPIAVPTPDGVCVAACLDTTTLCRGTRTGAQQVCALRVVTPPRDPSCSV